jgi:hypothetical protein
MKQLFWMAGLSAIAFGCGSADTSKAVVRGELSGSANTPGLRALAKTDHGKFIWTDVDANGRFALSLPKGKSYRIMLARPTADGRNQIVGHLVSSTSNGKSLWMAPSGSLVLGKISRLSEMVSVSGVKMQSEGADDDGEEDDDNEGGGCHEEDDKDDGMCKSADGDKDEELGAENDPGDKAASSKGAKGADTDEDGESDDDDHDQDDIKSCGGPASPPAPPAPPPASPPADLPAVAAIRN